MKHLPRIAALWIWIALIVLGGHQGCVDKRSAPEVHDHFVLSDTMMQAIETARVDYDSLRNEFSFYGKIAVDNNKLVEVFPIAGGKVLRVYAALGDYVQKGQVLATIRSTEVAGFEKELKDAQTDLAVAANQLRVAQELYAGKLNAEKDVLEAKSQYEKAESQLYRIQETYQIYRIKPGAIYEVVAPISGFVIEKKINQDMQLRSDRSDNIFDIAEINDVLALANVNESDIGQIRLGMKAFVHVLSYPDTLFQGTVDKIYTVIDPSTKAMKVGIRLRNNGFLLKPEMRAKIRITYTEPKQMLVIPEKALVFDKSKYFVMVFKSRTDIETRQVEVFRRVAGMAYIQSGLSEGERVITSGQLLIYDALND
ncbi:MAG: efflux RND transporter periplasmic adaptor subunit [Bacteroidota bacterium]|nr:efflux RND transporter periplasmic adaptor subunit [Candidatus Kapabacteria bacterium]MDW8220468.1 efflux RND transporter periplasmic adaptor subunit [Bacteroidota bacterium]